MMAGVRIQNKHQGPENLFKNIYKEAKSLGLSDKDWIKLEALTNLKLNNKNILLKPRHVRNILSIILAVLASTVFVIVSEWPVTNKDVLAFWLRSHGAEPSKERCLVDMTGDFMDIVRPPIDCRFCEGVAQIDRVSNITPEMFERKYAYSGQPVIVEDATTNWTAMGVYSFDFFKQIYKEDSSDLRKVNAETDNCLFLAYQTEFDSLGEAFSMSEDRALMKDGSEPWYIGWSNCDFSAGNMLRKHYDRPYFLPRNSELMKQDWIFMGSPGHGAPLHADNVDKKMSWQAQITSRKRWTLMPPLECYFRCVYSMTAVVEPGEIIIMDSNKWFHSTRNIGSNVSICIGAEYD